MSDHGHTPLPEPGTVFVGRQRERAVLHTALTAASGGQQRLVLLAGEPGIGKTRLAEELARLATMAGAVVRWGRCWEGAGAPAFWPWIQVLRAQCAATAPADLRARLGAGAAELSRLLPDLPARLPGLATAPLTDDAGARFRLFDAVADFLRSSAAAQPLVVILEDVHWAEPASLDLLRFLVDEVPDGRMLVMATYRDTEVPAGHPLAELLGTLRYQPRVQRLHLEGLSEAETGRLVEALGGQRSASLTARIYRQSGGNPFFVTELAQTLAGAPAPRIPDSVRDAIRHRLRQLSDPCQRVLRIAAVLGSEFRLGILEQVAVECGAPQPLLRVLDEARDARVLVEVQGAAGGYRFVHALIHEVLYTGLPLATRLRLHWQVATALEAQGEPNREHGAFALAHHFAEAIAGCADEMQRGVCVDKAVDYATRAAEDAVRMAAYAEALAHYERAVGVLEEWRAADKRALCEVLVAIGEVQVRASAGYAVRSAPLRRAAALAQELGEADLLVRAAFALSTRTFPQDVANDAHVALLRAALDAVGPHDSSARARLLGYLAVATSLCDPGSDSASLSAEALAVARRVGDPRMLWSVLCSRWSTLTEPERTEERMALATEVVQVGEQLGDREVLMYGRFTRLYEALELGEVSTMEHELVLAARLADDLRQPLYQSRACFARAALALLGGRFVEAEQLSLEALGRMQHAEQPIIFAEYVAQLSVAYWEEGRLDELEPLWRGSVEESPGFTAVRPALAWIHAELGHTDAARAEIELLSGDDFAAVRRGSSRLLQMALLARACAVVRDTTHAGRLYGLLLPYARYLAVEKGALICLGSVSWYLGLLAHTVGRWDDAIRHLEDSLSTHTRLGSPPWIANAQWALAAALVARDEPGDRERAAELLVEVLQTTQQLGMRRLQREAHALQEQIQVRTTAGRESAPGGAPPCRPPFLRGSGIERGRSSPPPVPATFRQEGDYWVIGFQAPVFRLKDRIGLRYLAVLLRNPGREFLAIDLVGAVHPGEDDSIVRGAGRRPALGGSEPYFDAQARRAYAQRLQDLHAALGAIAENDAALGHYLTATIKTGAFCSYSPDRRDAPVWEL